MPLPILLSTIDVTEQWMECTVEYCKLAVICAELTLGDAKPISQSPCDTNAERGDNHHNPWK